MARRVGCNRSGAGGKNPSPTHGGRFAVNVVGAASPTPRGGVKTPPYDANDKGVPQMGCGREGQGRAAARPRTVGGWLPGNGRPRKARQSPSGLASSASSPLRGAPFCAGEARERSLPIRGGGREAGRRGSRACGWLPVNGLLRKVAGGIYAAPTELPFPPAGVRGNSRV